MKWVAGTLFYIAITLAASVKETPKVGYAALAGTTGGSSAATAVTVNTQAALTSALTNDNAKIILVSGSITGTGTIAVGSNTSLLGQPGSSINGIRLRVVGKTNVILRNLKITKVVGNDAITIENSTKVWVDHNDLSSDKDHDKDYYDGLLDITYGSNGITVSNTKFSNHFKTSLLGSSDELTEDKAITVTFHGNYWTNCGSRTPSLRFGRSHVFNDYFENNEGGINTRVGAEMLIENNVFEGTKTALQSTAEGKAVQRGNVYNGAAASAPVGSFTTAPYSYSLLAASSVKASATANAGQKLPTWSS